MDLFDLRSEIDGIDDEIVRLFCARMKVSESIAAYKKQQGLAIYDPDREAQKLMSLTAYVAEGLDVYIKALYEKIFELSRDYQSKATKGKFGLLGAHVGHSASPKVHALLGDYEYKLYSKKPEEVEAFLKTEDFDGLNVTMPYKQTVIPFCTQLSPAAQRIGSVNTLVRQSDGTLYGDNTDYFGFIYLLLRSDVAVKNKKAIILGNGGAAATVKVALNDLGVSACVTISRVGADNYEHLDQHFDAQIIVNATPVGMYPNNGDTLIDLSQFKSCEAVFDLINNPLRTQLLIQAESLGVLGMGGLYMLVAQAKRAGALFLGDVAAENGTKETLCSLTIDPQIERVAAAIKGDLENVVLIGMPGCGKTTVGRVLAGLTGREFFDTDEMIVAKTGQCIDHVFKEAGEAAFRKMETEVIRELSKKTGCVIATGGGVVLRAENQGMLRQNGVMVYLNRAIHALPTEGRPLSLSQGIEAIYRQRRHLYERWCDYEASALEGAAQSAAAIKELLKI
ncbi:MAG: chorismate mutase [Oscillospiraceae bacterium]|nr:chorismate mutase [Oscillospiraceae bacterium]